MTKRADALKSAKMRRLAVVKVLRKNNTATNSDLQEAYGSAMMNTEHMGLLRRAVAEHVQHPERYSAPTLRKKLGDGIDPTAEALRKQHIAKYGNGAINGTPVDRLAGLKAQLEKNTLPSLLGFFNGSDVACVHIRATTNERGDPWLEAVIDERRVTPHHVSLPLTGEDHLDELEA